MRAILSTSLLAAALILPAAVRADTLLGLAGPFTGPVAPFGEQMRHGADMAVADINAAGGVLGQKLVLAEGDDACDPKQGVAVANELAGKGVKAVIGHFCSGTSIPASDVYQDENLVQITPGSTNPTLTERGLKNVFRVCGRDDQQGRIDGLYLAQHFKGGKIAILDDKQAYGEGLANEVRKALNAAGIHETLDDKINPGEKDYATVVTRLKQAGVDVVFYGGLQNEAGLLVRQMREQGLKTVLMGGDALVTREFWSITGAAGNGTLMSFPPDPAKDPRNKDLVARFAKAGIDPEGYTFYTYAAVQAWAGAVKAAGTTDTGKVEEALHAAKFDTVIGTLQFDGKGDVKAPGYVVYAWQDGKYAQLPGQDANALAAP